MYSSIKIANTKRNKNRKKLTLYFQPTVQQRKQQRVAGHRQGASPLSDSAQPGVGGERRHPRKVGLRRRVRLPKEDRGLRTLLGSGWKGSQVGFGL